MPRPAGTVPGRQRLHCTREAPCRCAALPVRPRAQLGPHHRNAQLRRDGRRARRCWLANGGHALRGLTLISPWLDIALCNPDIDTVAPSDPWLARDGLRLCGRRWAADLPLDDPRVSPIFGDPSGLPPVHLYIGTDDILAPDCRRLRDAMPSSTLTYQEEPAAIHVYPLLPTPEGRAARRELLDDVAARIS
ncbi:alpha/beta hydrolase [Mycobacterium sp. NPDC006124]|uniref:alpha/beta hydrolase n=1 Tax=Mycobacterium sp. NPDC006124 TaxID=3156729 RepID=UPI0033B03F2C